MGIAGLGMMGRTHYEVYRGLPDADVVAIADADPRRAAGDFSDTAGNILEDDIERLPDRTDRIKGTADFHELITMPDVDVVDVCLPTPLHLDCAVSALEAGKHVLCEKPLARTSAAARRIAAAATQAKGLFMPAMCMRFWPGWTWLKEAVADGRYGPVRAAVFQRLASMPAGWYRNAEQSGGALLDLHIHDTDFIYHLFGRPRAVFSRGYSKTSETTDHVATHYIYDDVPLVTAEGGWCLANGFGFSMRYAVNFDEATAEFDLAQSEPLVLSQGGKQEAVPCGAGHGYTGEIRYFLDCVQSDKKPTIVTADDAVQGLEIIEAEARSIESGQIVTLD